ncbi:MAG: hypothetical protein NTX44_14235 [Ignavibacteriales bacterium]|nr:hypothetical protein [Ignavibacteriales bacterium]
MHYYLHIVRSDDRPPAAGKDSTSTEEHNGAIEVKSREGKSSTFIVRLPVL